MSNNDIPLNQTEDKPRPVKRRARTALSCQRCRKQRSKCSRTKPSCDQCIEANVDCVYLEIPGDLESTALRNRFSGLEDQIHSLLHEFSILEDIVHTDDIPLQPPPQPTREIATQSLSNWNIYQSESAGLSIDTHLFHVTDIYSTLIQFAQDNSAAMTLYPEPSQQLNNQKPQWLTRNNALFPNVRLSHFTSLRPSDMNETHTITDVVGSPSNSVWSLMEDNGDDDETPPEPLPSALVEKLLRLYKDCLLYGAVQPFDTLFIDILLHGQQQSLPRAFQLLYASIVCHMLPHAFYWHREIFEENAVFDAAICEQLSLAYYKWAKRLLSSLYFDTPSLMTCHAICNLVLYHMEHGNTSVVYIYSGMAVRMALSLQLYREDALDTIAQEQAEMFPVQPQVSMVKEYARSLLWFMYFIDTASSHYHNKPYEIHLDDHVSTTTYFHNHTTKPTSTDAEEDYQAYFQFIEFQICQITRDIRRTIFNHPEELQTSYEEIERIERRLLTFQNHLLPIPDHENEDMSLWKRRCLYKQWIRHHGHWILIHQSYLPTPMSVQRCTTAAFALVDLFDRWAMSMDCYFRPCVHELKQACEILLYHVDQNTPIKQKALEGLMRLITVLLKTPVGDIARTRPFVQKVLHAIQTNK